MLIMSYTRFSFVTKLCCVQPVSKLLKRQSPQKHVRNLTVDGHKTWQDWRSLGNKANIVLMGSPGSGKTTTGRILGQQLDMSVVDVDDDILEPAWGTSVASKLAEIGDFAFIEEEGRALLSIEVPQGSVVSLTGSVPLHAAAMSRLAQSGVVVFLDVCRDAIMRRLYTMKVDRIVGQRSATMTQILDYRQDFYERWYDVRVIVEKDETQASIAQKICAAVSDFNKDEGFVSSRGGADDIPRSYVSFLETVLRGLAPDGGLYVKSRQHQPRFSPGQMCRLVDLDFRERSLRVLERWIHPLDLRPQEIRSFLYKAYRPNLFTSPEVAPIRKLSRNYYMQELFHGPTGSFKDASLQLMPEFFVKAMETFSDVAKYLIVVATSGDTGGAVLDGFSRHATGSRVGVLVLYPLHGISKIQLHQMTTMQGDNIRVLGVDSDFDFCQTVIKQVFSDVKLVTEIKDNLDCRLSAANSINWGRLLPQVLYHVSGYLELVRMGHITFGSPIDICVPTGNFGNILSAYYAKEMGIPIRRLICASNANHVLTDFIRKGVYILSGKTLQRTASPSIDILQSSNLERLIFHLSGENPRTVREFYYQLHREGLAVAPTPVWEQMREMFLAGYATENECREITLSTFKATGYMMDPHTAVGRAVAKRMSDGKVPTVVSGTAHFAKFVDKILPFVSPDVAWGEEEVARLMAQAEGLARLPPPQPYLQALVDKPVVHRQHLPADYASISHAIAHFAAQL